MRAWLGSPVPGSLATRAYERLDRTATPVMSEEDVRAMTSTPPDLRVPLGAVVRAWRAWHGWSVTELARRAQVSKGYVSEVERGKISRPKPEQLEKLATALQISAWDIHIRRLPPGREDATRTPAARHADQMGDVAEHARGLADVQATPPSDARPPGAVVSPAVSKPALDEIGRLITAAHLSEEQEAIVLATLLDMTRQLITLATTTPRSQAIGE